MILRANAALDRLALLGHPDFAEAAFTDLFEQFVAANHLGRGFLGWGFDDAGPLSIQGGSCHKAVAGKMFLQQLVHLAAERDIPAAGGMQVSRARLRRGHLQGFKEDFPFPHDSNRFNPARSRRRT